MRAIVGARDAFDVKYDSGGRILRSRVEALTQKEAVRRLGANPSAPATFRTLGDGSVGYLEYRGCEPGDALGRALHDAFSRAKAAGVRALIVDVRHNGGGADPANDQVLNYLTSKPYVQGTRFSVRASRRLKEKYGFFGYVQRYFAPSAWFAPEGSVITIDVPEIFARTTPGDNALRFNGPIEVLVGPGTFSSAMSFAQTVQDFGIATLVGEPLGEPLASNGQVVTVRAPRTSLDAGIASNSSIRQKHGRGVRS